MCVYFCHNICDRLCQKSSGGTKSDFLHHLHGNEKECYPQGLILSDTFINDMDTGTEDALSKFADDTKLGGVVGRPEGCATIQGDPDRLEKWADRYIMKFSKETCEDLRMGRKKPRRQCLLEATQRVSSFAEKDLGVLVNTKLKIRQQCALATKKVTGILRCIWRTVATTLNEKILPLSAAKVIPGILCTGFSVQKRWIHWRECSKRLLRYETGTPHIRGKVERSQTLQSGEGSGGISLMYINT